MWFLGSTIYVFNTIVGSKVKLIDIENLQQLCNAYLMLDHMVHQDIQQKWDSLLQSCSLDLRRKTNC